MRSTTLAVIVGVVVGWFGWVQYRTVKEIDTLNVRVAAIAESGPRQPTVTRRPPAEPVVPKQPLSFAGRVKGSDTARVGIIEYSDFQCPFCGAFATETLPGLEREYIDSGKIALNFRHLPLDSIHSSASKAALMAECAGEQDKFWEMHDRLFANQNRLAAAPMVLADELGLRTSDFSSCMNSGRAAQRIRTDAAEAQALGIISTPTFVLGMRLNDGTLKPALIIPGAKPLAVFRATIETLLGSSNH